MDALILSCGTGGGHDSAAQAVLEAMNIRGHKAKMLNPYTLKSDRLADGVNNTYIATARHIPRTFGAVYKIGDVYRRLPFRSPIPGCESYNARYFSENGMSIYGDNADDILRAVNETLANESVSSAGRLSEKVYQPFCCG